MGRQTIISRFRTLQPEVRILHSDQTKSHSWPNILYLLYGRSNSNKDGECGLGVFLQTMECAWKEVKKDQGGSECVGTGPAAAHPMHNQHPAFLFPITTHLSSLLIPPRPRTKQHNTQSTNNAQSKACTHAYHNKKHKQDVENESQYKHH